MGKACRAPMQEREIAELEDVLRGAAVATPRGRRGSIPRIARRFAGTGTIPGAKPHACLAYGPFRCGALGLGDPAPQERVAGVLGERASGTGLPTSMRIGPLRDGRDHV